MGYVLIDSIRPTARPLGGTFGGEERTGHVLLSPALSHICAARLCEFATSFAGICECSPNAASGHPPAALPAKDRVPEEPVADGKPGDHVSIPCFPDVDPVRNTKENLEAAMRRVRCPPNVGRIFCRMPTG